MVHDRPLATIGVLSAAPYVYRRNAVRETWMRFDEIKRRTVLATFVVTYSTAAFRSGSATPPPADAISGDLLWMPTNGSLGRLVAPLVTSFLWYRHATRKAPNLFFANGAPTEVGLVRKALDAADPIPNVSPYALADALTSFLNALARPVVPKQLLPEKELSDAQALRTWSSDFLTKLPHANYNTFVYVIAFFKDLLLHAAHNLLTPAKLSAVVCNSMLPDGDAHDIDKDTLYSKHYMNSAVQYLLTSPAL